MTPPGVVVSELSTMPEETEAAVDEPGPETPGPERPGPETPGPERPGPEDWGMVAVYVAVAAAVVVVVGRLSYFVYRHRIIKKSRNARLAARTQMV
ncbi:hypothetical protein INR49_007118 [Caranx melampygus]|nr:hypothetical protein INR49_007118 [Caranx melampygus]